MIAKKAKKKIILNKNAKVKITPIRALILKKKGIGSINH